MIILESCIPYTAHLHKLGNAYFVLFLIEAGTRQAANQLHDLLVDINKPDSCETLDKKLKDIKKLAHKLKYDTWAETLQWRSEMFNNESALSALGRKIQYGYELICLGHEPKISARTSDIMKDKAKEIIDKSRSFADPCPLLPILNHYPGLVHFVIVDRVNHRMMAPALPLLQRDETLDNMWRMFFTSLQWLQEGIFELMWDDKQMSYSHFIWMEDLNDMKVPWNCTWQMQTGTLGYPALLGSSFYQNLAKSGARDPEMGPEYYLQLFCIHLAITTPESVLEQATRLGKQLKSYLNPTAMLDWCLI